MPSLDANTSTVWFRVVFDGLAGAGKTTSVHALAELFDGVREGNVVSPETTGRATAYFDWLELRAGRMFDLPARVLVLSVPGQAAFSERRWAAFDGADACVLVCDAAAPIEHARLALSVLRDASPRGDIPFVVQANKTDLPGALAADALAAGLGLSRDAVFATNATSHAGVRDTLLRAVALARDAALRTYDSAAALPAGRPRVEDALARLNSIEHSPEGEKAVSVRASVLDRWRGA